MIAGDMWRDTLGNWHVAAVRDERSMARVCCPHCRGTHLHFLGGPAPFLRQGKCGKGPYVVELAFVDAP